MRHRPELDGIRALAILGVFAAHANLAHLHGGGVGVQLFFSLSGFLITTLLLAEDRRYGRVGLGRFYGRRAVRLLPAVLVLLVVVTGLTVVFNGPSANYQAIPQILLYFSNWIKALVATDHLGWYGHMWSLAIEEQFYLLWPAILLFVCRAKLRPALVFCVLGMLGALLTRVLLYHGAADLNRVLYGTDVEADQLLGGCALALILQREQGRLAVQSVSRWMFGPALAWLVIVVVALPTASHPGRLAFYATTGRTFDALSSAVVIGAVMTKAVRWPRVLLSWAPLVALGRISYGFYLWHVPLLNISYHLTSEFRVPLAFVLSVLIAALSYYLVEKPLQRRYRDRVAAGGPHATSSTPTVPTIRT